MNDISDESVMDVEKRRYYIQSYQFTLMGFLIDEDEFEVKPAISRVLQLIETETKTYKSKKTKVVPSESSKIVFNYDSNSVTHSETFDYTANLTVGLSNNVTNYFVYINNLFYGNNTSVIQINNGDTLQIDIQKLTLGEESYITLEIELL